jgi:hypothetical protein
VTGYADDIKPLFREHDRSAMLAQFDLWSYDDVVQHSDAILAQVAAGTMPCDGPWPSGQVELLRAWVSEGTPG